MTATDPTVARCTSCGSVSTSLTGSGAVVCLDCGYIGDVNGTGGPIAGIDDIHEGIPIDQVLHQLESINPETYQDRLAELIDGGAVLEGGQVATVVSFTDKHSVIVRLTNGDLEDVPFADVQRILPPVRIPDPTGLDPETIEADPVVGAMLEMAKIIIRAGVQSVNGTGENVTPGIPPSGYLPAGAVAAPVVEQAAALAVAILIDLGELDVDMILTAVGAVTVDPDQGNLLMEEPDGE